MNNFGEKVSFIWSVADLLRGPYKPAQYGKVMLPLTVIRRLDCVLERSKEKVLKKVDSLRGGSVKNIEPILNHITGFEFHNTSRLDFEKLKGEPANIAANLTQYIKKFSSKAREIIEYFEFEAQIAKLDEANRLYLVVSKFCEMNLHPDKVSNHEMGYIFEELIRRFSEQANEQAGDHFTPREVIRLMVNLLFEPDSAILTTPGIVRTLLDPACGTGGMLSVAEEYLRELNPDARLEVFGQDYNKESYAICGSDMMIKGQSSKNIVYGNSFTRDGFPGRSFDYLLANPPFGVEWKPEEDEIRKEHDTRGYDGRFGAGLPRINDGSLIFLQHMISKFQHGDNGSRLGIVFNGSPLFTGSAGSGESNIRQWIIENDWLEAIIAMPDQLFYNTGISTYIWIVTNRKRRERQHKVQLINATDMFVKMRKSLGNKRNEISEEQIAEITRLYGRFEDGEHSKVFDNEAFGYWRITVERPLRLNFAVTQERLDRLKMARAFAALAESKKKNKREAAAEITAGQAEQQAIIEALETIPQHKLYTNREKFTAALRKGFKTAQVNVKAPLFKTILAALSERDETADVCTGSEGNPEPDAELRDYENVPLKDDIEIYFEREVRPHVPDAWIDHDKTKKGYEINFNRYFYKYVPPRPLEEIEADIKTIEKEILEMLREVAG